MTDKKKKIDLTHIKIKSFITALENLDQGRFKGGDTMGTVGCPVTYKPRCPY